MGAAFGRPLKSPKLADVCDTILPAFIGRVGDREVQIETTIQPLPRDAMIAVGKRMMETIAGR